MRQGKLIVLYGINAIGKSKQRELLASRLRDQGIPTQDVKYALYDLEPSGPLIDNYLRSNPIGPRNINHFRSREVQLLQVVNRLQYQPRLQTQIDHGISVVAEDYAGTGIAWGVASRNSLSLMEYINSGTIREDMAFLLVGKQFRSGIESNHTHESNPALMRRSRKVHLELAEKYGWIHIDANRSPTDVSDEIFDRVKKLYERPELKFYLGIAISGSDRSNLECGQEIGRVVQKHGTILDDVVLDPKIMEIEARNVASGVNVSKRDMDWIRLADYLIVEGSIKSTGVGMEIQKALSDGTPTLFLYRTDQVPMLTRMISHRALYDPNLAVQGYTKKEELEGIINKFVEDHRFWIA